jgi:hypothetical protein
MSLLQTGCPGAAPVGQTGKACHSNADCGNGLTCRNNTCTSPTALCSPGETTCDGSSILQCSADGLSYLQETTCAAGCANGACIESICKPGEMRCDGSTLKQCSADGTTFQVQAVCQLGCDATTSTCVAQTCQPGSRQCTTAGLLATCKTDGSGWTTQNCNASGPGQCVSLEGPGSVSAYCEQLACTPGTLRCEGLQVMQCDPSGASESVITTCAAGCSGGACTAATCLAGQTECSTDGLSVQRCNSLGTGWDTQPCNAVGAGACATTVGAGGTATARCVQAICQPGMNQCDGNVRLECAANGLSETVVQTCAFGCSAAGCLQPACDIGQLRCNGNWLEVCSPDQQSFLPDELCITGCSPGTGGAKPACIAPTCAPLDARCTADASGIQQCRADGSGWVTTTCSTGLQCDTGSCVPPPAPCVAGTSRCEGGALQTCVAANGQTPAYTATGRCLGQCAGPDTCDANGECAPFGLQVALVPSGTPLPADGQSTFLVVSDPLAGPDGTPVPDGTLVTISVLGASLASADEDPTTTGVQVPVVGNRIDFMIRAPAQATTATVGARIESFTLCSASLSLTFGSPSTVTTRYVADDFSTTRARATQSPTADWDTTRGVLTLNAFNAGDGRDGDLIVPNGQAVDLSKLCGSGGPCHSTNIQDYPDMAVAPLVQISEDGTELTLGSALDAFKTAGTRVLVINLRGQATNAASVGNYEFATVSGLDGARLALTAPLTQTYGAGGNSDAQLAGQIVNVIRVPQYNRVIVGGTVTGPAFNGMTGGVLALFASSPLSVSQGGSQLYGTGTITMSGLGYRGADQPPSGNSGSLGCCSGSSNGLCGTGLCCVAESQTTYSGEGPEGIDFQTTIGGIGVSGGGYACGSGDVKPITTQTAPPAGTCALPNAPANCMFYPYADPDHTTVISSAKLGPVTNTLSATADTVALVSGTWGINIPAGDVWIDQNGIGWTVAASTSSTLILAPLLTSSAKGAVSVAGLVVTLQSGFWGTNPPSPGSWVDPGGTGWTISSFTTSTLTLNALYTEASGMVTVSGNTVTLPAGLSGTSIPLHATFVDRTGAKFVVTAETPTTLTVSGNPASGTNGLWSIIPAQGAATTWKIVGARGAQGTNSTWGLTAYDTVHCPAVCQSPVTTEPNPLPSDFVTYSYWGSSGSFSLPGGSTCAPFGPGIPYGDQLLSSLYMGAGSGSVSRSSAHTCATTQANCPRTSAGTCCLLSNTPADGCTGQAPTPYCSASIDFWDQSFPGVAGGGIIFITAAALELDNTSTIVSNGATSGINSSGGAGGSIYLRVRSLTAGAPGHLVAQGGGASALTGSPGRIRIDAMTVDVGQSNCPQLSSPSATCGAAPADTVQSSIVLTLPAAQYTLASALVLPVAVSIPEANGVFDPAASLAASNLSLALTEDTSHFGPVSTSSLQVSFGGPGQPPLGTSVEWLLSTSAASGATRGIAAMFVSQ